MMSRAGARSATFFAALALAGVFVAGCSTTAADLPLPGTSMRGETYQVTVAFDDALNLAVGAPVKINGVPVGRVDAIGVKDLAAVVTLDISSDTPLAAGSDFRLRTTTALGELFVDVVDPSAGTGSADVGTLDDGAAVGAEQSSSAPTVEDTLSAASLFINGGGLGQLQTIVDETNLMIGGREDTVRDVLHRVTSTAASITAMSGEIDAALIAITDASRVLSERQDTIDRALVDIAPAAQVLEQNTAVLVDLLTSIDSLGAVVIPTIEATHDDLVAMTAQAGPIFDQVSAIEPRIESGVVELLEFIDGLDAGVPASYLNTHLLFQPSVGVGDVTVIAPDPDRGPIPDILPDILPNLGGVLPLPTLPAPGQPGSDGAGGVGGPGNSLTDMLRRLGGGAR